MSAMTVTAQDITGYRAVVRSIMDGAPDDGKASPVFPFVLASDAFERMAAELRAQGSAGGRVHLGQEIQVYRLIRPGDEVTTDLELLGARREPRGVRLAVRCAVRTAGGTPLADLITAALFTGAVTPEPFGDIPQNGAPTPAGEPIPKTVTVRKIPVQTVRDYARVSRDDNPIHLEDAAAVAAGFPGVIAHGMSVLALVCEEVVDRFAGGDAARVRALSCRFSGPVRPDEPIEITVGGAADVVTFACRTPQGPALKSGWMRLGEADG
ncbi:MaoC/PaaZ C-terminal domain-containing protein [Dactylosporangium sp. NPDC048998]|uniref:MaoC/PaaZ C-terminal domain-containing protein n=1 Tax=Dactylosporangium sp. NPDC048998 TaxID=3363976 RepID=UPI00371BD0B6